MAYETPFTKESMIELANAITKAISEVAQTKPSQKVDFYLLLSSLAQVGFESGIKLVDDPNRKEMLDNTRILTQELMKKLDSLRVEFDFSDHTDLIAMSHALAIVSEIYSNRRDLAMAAIEQDEPTNI